MIEAVLVASALVAGMDWRIVGLMSAALWAPVPAGVTVGVAVAMGRRRQARTQLSADLAFAESVIGELRSGASLRAALRVACADRPGAGRIVRRLDVGEPLDRAVRGIGEVLPAIGDLVEAAVTTGGGGGRMLPIFEELMVQAAAEQAAAAELRTAVAPVRASMTVLVGAPVTYLLWSGFTGRLTRLLALPGGLWIASGGTALFLAGILVMVLLTRAGRR